MPTVPTFDALYVVGQSEMQSRDSRLTGFYSGSALDAITGMGAMLADEVIRVGVDYFAAQFVDTAVGDDLDALALDRFGLIRNAASASVVTLTFTRSVSGAVSTVPAGTEVRGSVGGVTVTYTTDEDTDWAAASLTVSVLATCTATGTTGNVATGVLTTIVDAIPDEPAATVTNAERGAGGGPAESDDAFRDRIRRYFGTLSKGTVAALETAAIGVAGVSFATVDESKMAPADGGYVQVYVGDPDARGNAALAALAADAVDLVRAAGVDVRVVAAEREEIDVALTIYVRAGADTSALVAAVRPAALAYSDGLAPAATWYRSQVDTAVCSVSPDVLGCSVTTPTTDKVPSSSNKAIRVLSADLAITAIEV